MGNCVMCGCLIQSVLIIASWMIDYLLNIINHTIVRLGVFWVK